jgi:hypothetical protein
MHTGPYRVQLPVDDAFGRSGFRTIGYRVQFDPVRTCQRCPNDADQSVNASEISRAVVRVERHPFVILDRLLSDDRGKAATAAGVRSDESNGGLRKPLDDAAPAVFDFLYARSPRGFQWKLLGRTDVEHQAHVGTRRSATP